MNAVEEWWATTGWICAECGVAVFAYVIVTPDFEREDPRQLAGALRRLQGGRG